MGQSQSAKNVSVSNFTYGVNQIPTSPLGDEWDLQHGPAATYQAHFAVQTIVEYFEEHLGHEFQEIHVASNTSGARALALGASTEEIGYIVFGTSSSGTMATMDIVGHELAHLFMFEFLDTQASSDARSLHEGLADMFGTYFEMLYQQEQGGTVDWVGGDDNTGYTTGRDLSNPKFNCFTDVEAMWDESHKRGQPLGHWFYLVCEEGTGSIAMEEVMHLLTNALSMVPSTADYEELMAATLDIALMQYGVCSPEFRTISNAWNQICVPTGYPTTTDESLCNFSITGPDLFCEEHPMQSFHVTNGVPGAIYRFYIVGQESTGYSSSCGMQGNSQEGCTTLALTGIPTFNYYPQKVKIVVYNLTYGPAYQEEKIVTIYDCDGDDPTCEEYYNPSIGRITSSETPISQGITMLDVLTDDSLEDELKGEISVCNANGQIVFVGIFSDLKSQNIALLPGVYFLNSTMSNPGEVVKPYKLVIYD